MRGRARKGGSDHGAWEGMREEERRGRLEGGLKKGGGDAEPEPPIHTSPTLRLSLCQLQTAVFCTCRFGRQAEKN